MKTPVCINPYVMLCKTESNHLPWRETCSRHQAAAAPASLSDAVLISIATAVPAKRRVSLLEHWRIGHRDNCNNTNSSFWRLTKKVFKSRKTCPRIMSRRACRICCTAGSLWFCSQTRRATSLDSSWKICKHTCRQNGSQVSSPRLMMSFLFKHHALTVPSQSCNTQVHLSETGLAKRRGETRTVCSASTRGILATPRGRQCCLPGTYMLKKVPTQWSEFDLNH